MPHLRATGVLVLTLAMSHNAVASADPGPAADDPRLRAAGPAEQRLIEDATRLSPSVQRLIDRLACTDVFAYVQLTPSPQVRRGSTSLVAATVQGRYLRILISAGLPAWIRVQLLGHELQHALEIAENPHVTNEAGVRELFSRIGHSADSENQFETQAARDVENSVRLELLQAGSRPR